MVKGNNSRLPTELPREVLAKLDPGLAELYSQLPSEVAARISFLVREALPQRIHPNKVLKFAFLYATAERFAKRDAASKAVSTEHARRSKLELAGEIHGLQTGYRDDLEAKLRYRRGRQARQQIQVSIESVSGRWREFEQVVQKHRSKLPVYIQSRLSNEILGGVGKALQSIGISIVLDEDDLASEKRTEPERSGIAQTYIWWRLKLARYRGKWNDMHQLAFVWRMSPAASVSRWCTPHRRSPAP
jgi:hypothetical protein